MASPPPPSPNTLTQDHALAKALRRLQRADPSGGHTHLADCYRALSMLSVMNEQLTMKAGYTRGGEGGLSRTNQYLRYIISNIEELRMIKVWRCGKCGNVRMKAGYTWGSEGALSRTNQNLHVLSGTTTST